MTITHILYPIYIHILQYPFEFGVRNYIWTGNIHSILIEKQYFDVVFPRCDSLFLINRINYLFP